MRDGTNRLPLKRKDGFRRPCYGVFWRLPIGDGRGMGRFGAFNNIGLAQAARLSALGLTGLVLANCSGGQMSGKIDPRYGVAASARVVEPGQPVPKGGGVYRVGKPYTVAGRVYVPEENTSYSAEGMASWYGDDFHGRYTANGEIFDMASISAAHPTLPLPSYVRVTNLANRRSIVVRVNDRGPYARDRIIDVSVKTAELLGFYGNGVTRVRVEYVGRAPIEGSDDRRLIATLREGSQAIAPIRVTSSRPFAPVSFDSRSSRSFDAAGIPSPPDRPYRLGEDAREPSFVPAPTTELAAAARPRTSAGAPYRSGESGASPVSTYVPTRYDAASGFMNGRGLY
jgi:rare lipoprotein A